MGDNEWPTAVVYQLPPGIESFYDSDVQTGNIHIEKKTNQSMECLDIIRLFLYIQVQARRKVFAIGAANSGEGDGRKGVNFTIITCADPVPGKKIT